MNRRSMICMTAVTVLGFGLSASTADSAPKGQVNKRQLVGSWTIVSVDGYGPNPKGSLIFEANGRFSLQLVSSDIPKYLSNGRIQGTPAEYKATVEGSLSYFGTYSVSGSELTFHVEGCSFPNWTGTDQKRINLSVTGDELKYTNPAPSAGAGAAVLPLVWKRVK